MKMRRLITCFVPVVLAMSGTLRSQVSPSVASTSELRMRLASPQPGKHRAVPAVIWLEPLAGTVTEPFVPHGPYTLTQKNRMFLPHLQVIPVGAVVKFPNADPFFHNVFSLFDEKRFDLGLYEAGSSKSVTFSREGVSYIFCNIHPEMSAVVLALPTPLFAVADSDDSFVLRNIPPGDYTLHLWIEGVPQSILNGLSHHVHVPSNPVDLGTVRVPILSGGTVPHTNKFGDAYDPHSKSPYDH
jgi:hypothetical protein